jgi:hypothetical protein
VSLSDKKEAGITPAASTQNVQMSNVNNAGGAGQTTNAQTDKINNIDDVLGDEEDEVVDNNMIEVKIEESSGIQDTEKNE